MTEYINRKEATDHFEHILEATNDGEGYNRGWCDGVQFCIGFLKDLPTADVRENVHGKWIPISDIDKDRNQLFECDNCHHTDLHAYNIEVPFCWNCGADMR